MRTYEEYRQIVVDALPNALPRPRGYAANVLSAARYSLLAGGKRLRPVLLLAACEFAGGDIRHALSAALAVECMHTYSLIHDDLPAMDDDDLRRGMPSCHKKFGEACAILAGDGLNTHAFLLLSIGLREDPEHVAGHLAAIHQMAIAAGFLGMVAGQDADMAADAKNAVEDEIAFIHENKTAALIRAALIAGLSIGGMEDEKVLSDFASYGKLLGLAFQARDDYLDATLTARELGKTPGKDQNAGKVGCVSLLGLERTRERVMSLMREAKATVESYGEKAKFFTGVCEELADIK